jgi:hypothetical protein
LISDEKPCRQEEPDELSRHSIDLLVREQPKRVCIAELKVKQPRLIRVTECRFKLLRVMRRRCAAE